MLAYNENGKLTEYEETNLLKVCDSCHHIYKRRVEQQLEGMREREYDICPWCGEEHVRAQAGLKLGLVSDKFEQVKTGKISNKHSQ